MTCPRCGGSGWYISRAGIRLECECRAWERKVRAMAKEDQKRLDGVVAELMRRTGQ